MSRPTRIGYNYSFSNQALLRFAPVEAAMPIYEYRCTSCGHEVEALQKLSEPPLVACPSCSTDGLVKQVSAAGFHLKGSGWYATDFKGGSKPSTAKSADAAKPAGDGKSESKSEAKAESAAPSGGCGGGCACH
jgi:putative FmdB family regulatory protein